MDDEPKVLGDLSYRQLLTLAFACSGMDARSILRDVNTLMAAEERRGATNGALRLQRGEEEANEETGS